MKNRFKYELPSTLIDLYMGYYDLGMYLGAKDDEFVPSDGIINITSEI